MIKSVHCVLPLVYLPVEVADSSLEMRELYEVLILPILGGLSHTANERSDEQEFAAMESLVPISLLSRRRKEPYLDLANSFGRPEDTRGHLAFMRVVILHLDPLPYHSRPFQTRASCHVGQAILGLGLFKYSYF